MWDGKYQTKVQTALATQQQPFLIFKQNADDRESWSEEQPSHTNNTSAGAEEY